jgi:hypothetical protein
VLSADVLDPEEQIQGPDAIPTPSTRADRVDLYLVERGAWSLVWLAVVAGGFTLWGSWWWSPVVTDLAPLLVLGGLAGTAACWLTKSPRSRLLQCAGFVSVLVAMVFPEAILISSRRYYSTDSAAFNQVAARALLHGKDPYTTSMASAAPLFNVAARFWTYTTNGGHIVQFSYPAGSVLLNALAMALGVHHMVADWVDLSAWVVTAILLFVLLPASLRWLTALVAVGPFFLGTFSNGGTDAMFLPFLVVALWRWDRFGQGAEAGVARWIGPVALGVACSIKQTPWFCVPLLALGILLEARGAGRPAARLVVRYLATVLAVFGAINLPFLLWQPAAWMRGTLLPLLGGMIANGQGLVSLGLHGITGGADLTMLSAAGAFAFIALLAAFVLWYPQLKRIWVFLVAIPFFFAPRSLSTYLLDLFPVALVAAFTVRNASGPALESLHPSLQGLRRRSALIIGVPCAGVLVASFLAFTGAPLQLSLRSIVTTHGNRDLEAVTISVQNETSGSLTPHFMLSTGSNPAGFWTPAGNQPVVLGPHGSATVTLYAPALTPTPQPHSRWLLEAYTANPSWLSTSTLEPYPLIPGTAVPRTTPPVSPAGFPAR